METKLKFQQTADDIKFVTDEICEMLICKNESYGDSALNPRRIFARADTEEQIKVRLDDKLNRLAQGNGDHLGEDVVLDIMGYLVLLRIKQIRKKREMVDELPVEFPPSTDPQFAGEEPLRNEPEVPVHRASFQEMGKTYPVVEARPCDTVNPTNAQLGEAREDRRRRIQDLNSRVR